jgi:hypothetical protein
VSGYDRATGAKKSKTRTNLAKKWPKYWLADLQALEHLTENFTCHNLQESRIGVEKELAGGHVEKQKRRGAEAPRL